jgi:hypothetical protein
MRNDLGEERHQTNRLVTKGYHAAGFWVCIDDVFLTSRSRQRIQFVSQPGIAILVLMNVRVMLS